MNHHKGAALIVVLLIVMLTASLFIQFAYRESLKSDIELISGQVDRSVFVALSAERWAKKLLSDDARKSSVDTLDEDWTQNVKDLPIDDTLVTAQLIDLNRFINLNRFSKQKMNENDSSFNEYNKHERIVERLMRFVGYQGGEALDSLVDWQDQDDAPTRQGSESAEYQLLDTPYRSANTSLSHINELFFINGFDRELIDALRPYVAVFPAQGGLINVNTASKEVLAMLSPEIDLQTAQRLLEMREKTPWSSARAFIVDLMALKGYQEADGQHNLSSDLTGLIGVESDHFLLTMDVRSSDVTMRVESLISKEKINKAVTTKVISRSFDFRTL